MLVIPAIDLRGGKCVRLYQGRFDRETVYADDPAAVAAAWEEQGAGLLHLVDLDGARAGRPRNLDAVQDILRSIRIPVELGGGIRDLGIIEMVLGMGVDRVILGSAAVSRPELVAEAVSRFGDRIVVGIDGRDGQAAIQGWEEVVNRDVVDLALEMKEIGVRRVIYTDIARDGALSGPNLEAIERMARQSGLKVIASGGVSGLQDIANLKKLEPSGVEAVIVGRALYTGGLSLPEALAVAGGGAVSADQANHTLP